METHVTDQNFEQEISNYKGVALVDFWAPWCGPCQTMGPIIEELGKDMDGKAKVAKLNVDENPVQSEKYGVMSIPTMIIFKDGQESERLVGIQQKDTLKSKLEYYTN
ncbi:thioredoxin [candidate division CPR3 bacterium GWF2_35_18]|uniref:Thioredoxin n=1 Tax=candidate division CPR3 bacterium GW2011_GWF2_35_18 TaxID=1618350 RepID=A0A0G0BKQ3_UNCC3|nr:MAG: Thioredoxin [candidate division CPR3 bacterium GW2011_GWF2_35_18]OGB62831.1 MAG: thioredoxin [candidate division CPR3 bacterium GWF2_35_18]OGB65412.1 MAG: thioredoxin [candidate division CPR3 bacterium RIFOXYA2_FULL_35_13]OGB76846.1 MAG: thioredoxin [candidate division CPR3 bacterium RIFOXYC2_FULL_35_7]OGB79524.1 MAG: thioredoxin [candidate division CPR3 bacterium RIFOXYB2_FULL_35_8]